MHRFVSFNHRIFPEDGAGLPALSSAALYGKGVFTTLAIYHGEPFLWTKHWRRLNEHARRTGIELAGFSEKKVYRSLVELIERNGASDARCRMTFFDRSSSKVWAAGIKEKPDLLIQTADLRPVKQNISLTLSPFSVNSTSPLSGVKSCNYLENLLAFEEVRRDGFDEAIRMNERNEVVSACLANVFWLKDGRLFTPSLQTGCLAGTTREFLMEKEEVSEAEENPDALRNADSVFLTSAGIGIVQVKEFKGRKFGPTLHELTRILERSKVN